MPTDEELNEWKGAYECYDKDKDGKDKDHISPKDFGSVVRMLGYNPSEKELKAFQKEIGKDKIKLDDLNKIMPKVQSSRPPDSVDDLMESFKMFDKDGNGFISIPELKHIYTGMADKFDDEEWAELAGAIDDGTGTVAYEDLIKMMILPKA